MSTTLVRTLTDEERRTRAAVLYLQGLTQAQIGAELGVAGNTVSTWLSGLREEWKANAARDRMERIAEGLAKLDLLELTAWKGGDLRLVMKCIDIRFRVLGAYRPNVLVLQPSAWDAITIPPDHDPVESRLAGVQCHTNGHTTNSGE